MNLFNLKENKGPVPYEIKSSRSGFVVLFALMLSSVILAIAIGVSNVALKEIIFSTSAKATNDAFFSADTAAECALYNDRTDVNAFPLLGSAGVVTCATGAVSGSGDGTNASFSFIITGLGGQGQGCAKVVITKDNTSPPMITTISAKGYNLGDSSCDSSSTNRVERELEVNY